MVITPSNDDPLKRTAAVLYGSETGNAQNVAEELGFLLERLRYDTFVSELNHASLNELLRNSLVVLVVSTTGQGDLPANAQTFWRKLRSTRLRPGCLKNVQFASFGVGDSSYPQFNWASRKLYNRLTQLGAETICDRAEADEQHPDGVDGYLVPWAASLRQKLLQLHPLPHGNLPLPDDEILEPKWTLDFARSLDASNSGAEEYAESRRFDERDKHEFNGKLERNLIEATKIRNKLQTDDIIPAQNGIFVTVVENQRITPDNHWQDVRLLKLETNQKFPYAPGDALAIQPKNSSQDVEHFLSLMDWDNIADRPIEFRRNLPLDDHHANNTNSNHKGQNLPPSLSFIASGAPLTLRKLLTNYLDIMSIPRRSFFSLIAHFATDQYQKERLLEFTDPIYLDELYDYTTRPRRSILEVLQEFTSVKISWQWSAHVLPFMRSRQFSIASGGVLKRRHSFPVMESLSYPTSAASPTCANDDTNTTRFELLVAIVKYKTVIKRIREGICTRYIASLQPGQQLNITLHQGGLISSKQDVETKPALMIAPGTGVAPMRALIYERLALAQSHSIQEGEDGAMAATEPADSTSNTVLFFGCRNEKTDYFFRDEWDALIRMKKLDSSNARGFNLQVHAAFSRDQKHKIYVQDLIREQASLVHDLLCKKGGNVYVCGSSGKMPQAVREALIEVFQAKEEGFDRSASERYLTLLENTGRYKQETW